MSSSHGGSGLRVQYLTSRHRRCFEGQNGYRLLLSIDQTGLPYPVFAALHEVFARHWRDTELAGGDGQWRLAAAVGGDVRAGLLDWTELPGWVRYDVAGARLILAGGHPVAHDGAWCRVRDRWRAWHPAYVAMGPGAPHPALWHAAGFGPAEAAAAWASDEGPDAATLAAMAALRDGGSPG